MLPSGHNGYQRQLFIQKLFYLVTACNVSIKSDAYISVLPESDQERLKNGITVSDKTELQKIIEDYTS